MNNETVMFLLNLCVHALLLDGASAEAQGGKPYFGFKGNFAYVFYEAIEASATKTVGVWCPN